MFQMPNVCEFVSVVRKKLEDDLNQAEVRSLRVPWLLSKSCSVVGVDRCKDRAEDERISIQAGGNFLKRNPAHLLEKP
jgi:hypothetical protein